MKTLEELLLLWQEGSLSGEELVELKNHLGTREGRARLVDDILMTAVAIETLKADRVEGLSHSPLAGKGSAGGGRWSRRLARLAVAALILLALGLGAWIIFRAQEAQAAPSLIEQLVDWNLHLSEASSSDERQRIYQTQQANLQTALDHADLPGEDRALARLLLDNGSRLAANLDPLGEAERFSAVADTLADRLRSLNLRQDLAGIQRYTDLHNLVMARGVAASLLRAERALDQDRLGARLEAPGEAVIHQLGLTPGQGLVVRRVMADSPAARAGLQEHDILLELAGKPVASDLALFPKALAEIKPDDSVAALVLRRGQKVAIGGIAMPAVSRPVTAPHLGNRVFVPGPGGKGQSTLVPRDDGFAAFHHDNELLIRMNADLAAGRIADLNITIKDGASIQRFESEDEVPARYRDAVRHLIELGLQQSGKAPPPGGRGQLPPADVFPLVNNPIQPGTSTDGKGQSTVVPGDDGFTAFHRDGTLLIVVKADRVNGKIAGLNIVVKDSNCLDSFARLDDVPAKYRPVVEHLIGLGEAKVETKKLP